MLPDFAVPDLWVKAVVPEDTVNRDIVRALLAWLAERMSPAPPWDRETQ